MAKRLERMGIHTVADLLNFVRMNMPNGNPGSLSASTYNDLVALILKSNGFPAGMTELAKALASALKARPAGSLRDVQLVFVGTSAEGQQVEQAAAHTGARLALLDSSQPIPPGTSLPETPPEDYMPER